MSAVVPGGEVEAELQARAARAAEIERQSADTRELVVQAVAQAGKPGVFHAYQKEAIRLSHQHELLVVEKSRRIGLTWAFAGDDVVTAATARGKGGDDILYISYSFDMAREYIDACAGFAKAFMGIDATVGEFMFQDEVPGEPGQPGETRQIKAFRIDFASGFCIQALTSAPRSLRGKQGKVRIDEAAFVDNLAELLKAALALIMLGGSVVVISTHDGVDNDFNKLIQEIRAGEREGAVLTIPFAKAMADGLYERIAAIRGLDPSPEAKAAWEAKIRKLYSTAAEEELDCIPSKGTGAWLTYDQVERAEREGIPVLRWYGDDALKHKPDEVRQLEALLWCKTNLDPVIAQLDLRAIFGLGIDFARRADLSIVWPLQELQDRRVVTPFVIEMRNVPYREQEFVVGYLLDALRRWLALIDAGGNGGYLAERMVQRFGEHRVQEVHLRAEWWRLAGPPAKARFEDERVIIPKDRDTSADLRAIKVKGGIPYVPEARARSKGDDTPKGVMRHADAGVAFVLASEAVRQGAVGPIEFSSTGRNVTATEPTLNEDAGWGIVESDLNLRGY